MGHARHHGWGRSDGSLDPELVQGEEVWSADWISEPDPPPRAESSSDTIDIRELAALYQSELAGAPIDPLRHVTLEPATEPEESLNASRILAVSAALTTLAVLSIAVTALISRDDTTAISSSADNVDAPAERIAGVASTDEADELGAEIPSATVYVYDHSPADPEPGRLEAAATTARGAAPRLCDDTTCDAIPRLPDGYWFLCCFQISSKAPRQVEGGAGNPIDTD